MLATAALLTGDTRYADAAALALLDWIAKNPPGRGIAWANGFEAGIRAISLSLTFDALTADSEMLDRLYEPAVGSLWQHGRWICRDPSTHSSANNHRVGELVGLLSVALLAPELPESEAWAAQAYSELAREADRQIAGDGTGVEQSFAYTTFVLDLFLVAVALLDAVAVTPPASLTHALEHAAEALWAQLAPGETDPTYGDCDDGRAVRLDGNDARTGRGVAGGICARFGSSFARSAASELDLSARWMFGETGATRFERTASFDAPRSVLLRDAGFAILRHAETRVTFDAGPLGYLRLAAHGHADALSVTLSANGDELSSIPAPGPTRGTARLETRFAAPAFTRRCSWMGRTSPSLADRSSGLDMRAAGSATSTCRIDSSQASTTAIELSKTRSGIVAASRCSVWRECSSTTGSMRTASTRFPSAGRCTMRSRQRSRGRPRCSRQ